MSASESGMDPAAYPSSEQPPEPHYNPLGQSALVYRKASHQELVAAMLDRLSSEQPTPAGAPPLANLTTRSSDDPSVAMLDAWAAALDVLFFYQERIANEGFLRTAGEQRSLQELARTLGWELRAGVAAGTFLAFTVDESPQSPGVAIVPQGTRVQSAPAQGQRPPTFETSRELIAHAEWNELRVRQSVPPRLELYATASGQQALRLWSPEGSWQSLNYLYLRGTATRLQVGDWLLLEVCTADGQGHPLAQALPVQIAALNVELQAERTRVELALGDPAASATAPPPALGVLSVNASELEVSSAPERVMATRWSERELGAQVAVAGWDSRELCQRIAALRQQPKSQVRVWALRQAVGCFGQSASLPELDENATQRSIWSDSSGTLQSDRFPPIDLMLERPVKELVPQSWIVLQSSSGRTCAMQVLSTVTQVVSDYATTARVTGLELRAADLRTNLALNAVSKSTVFFDFTLRATTVLGQSELLPLADHPISAPVLRSEPLVLDTMTLGLALGQPVILTGEPTELPGTSRTELTRLAEISHHQGYTWLRFAVPLMNSYSRTSVRLLANVVAATHGETHARQVLGSGDHSQKRQQFVLSGAPLTYTSAANANGAVAALEVRVGEVLWEEVPSLYGQPPGRTCYEVRQSLDGDGRTLIRFGDGENGARLPTGHDNVVATYRTGLGLEGRVAAGSLTLLPIRPPAIKAVTNPLPSTGAAAPDGLEDARQSAPLSVRALDRVVSLRDYEDFARSFAGIAKARALLRKQAGRPWIHLTIGGADGADIPVGSELYSNLCTALTQVSDPEVPVVVQSYARRLFVLRAQLTLLPRYSAAKVLSDAAAALISAYSFAVRDFGQPVVAAEVVEKLQRTEGVQAVVLVELRASELATALPLFPSPSPVPPELLTLDTPTDSDASLTNVQPLGLLLLHPAGLQLEVMP